MKEKLHPTWYPEAKVTCACGNSWTTGATVAEIRTDICSACHPFYTGEQRIVDTEGQVDRFMKRLQVRDTKLAESAGYGPEPKLPAPDVQKLPIMKIAPTQPWKGDEKPSAANGLQVDGQGAPGPGPVVGSRAVHGAAVVEAHLTAPHAGVPDVEHVALPGE